MQNLKLEEKVLGYAQYGDQKYPFLFENSQLFLFPGTEIEWNKQKLDLFESVIEFSKLRIKHEWISNNYIKGITNDEKQILFITKGDSSNNNGFLSFEIQCLYIYESQSSTESINGLIFKANEIDDFFDPARVFRNNISVDEKDKSHVFIVKSDGALRNSIKCGSYSYCGVDICVEVSAFSTLSFGSEKPLSAQSQFYLEFSKPITIDMTFDIILHQRLFLQYVCYRKNIEFSEISVIDKNNEGLRKRTGQIYILDEEDIETNKKEREKVLIYESLKQNTVNIFQAIADNKLYFEHFSKSAAAKKSYGVDRIILIFAAFEREFSNIFPVDLLRSKQYLEVKSQVVSLLNDYEKNFSGKIKKYINSFKRIISNSDSKLSDRITYAINRCFNVLEVFLKYNYEKVDQDLVDNIANRMNDIRNDIAHGNLNLQIEPVHLFDFKIMEILLYVMRLNEMGIDTFIIKKAICKLFGYSIYIQDNEKLHDKN